MAPKMRQNLASIRKSHQEVIDTPEMYIAVSASLIFLNFNGCIFSFYNGSIGVSLASYIYIYMCVCVCVCVHVCKRLFV